MRPRREIERCQRWIGWSPMWPTTEVMPGLGHWMALSDMLDDISRGERRNLLFYGVSADPKDVFWDVANQRFVRRGER